MSKTIKQIRDKADADVLKLVADTLKSNVWSPNLVAANKLGVTEVWLSRYIKKNRADLIAAGVRAGYTGAWRN